MKFTSLLVLAGLPAGSAFVAPAKVFHGAAVGPTRSTERSSASSCQMMARVPFIAGNWKMNPIDLGTAKDLAKAVSPRGISFGLGYGGRRCGKMREGPLLPHTHTYCGPDAALLLTKTKNMCHLGGVDYHTSPDFGRYLKGMWRFNVYADVYVLVWARIAKNS